ncbi:hypothetical protein F5X98DRAFT_368800 [Xylaria grammica]|nr:hypothetical protein F5X98DRAFT_368800 [Xylaria grammica]
MNGGLGKARARRSRAVAAKAVPKTLPAAAAATGVGIQLSRSGDPAGAVSSERTPRPGGRRRGDPTRHPRANPLLAERARLTRTGARPPRKRQIDREDDGDGDGDDEHEHELKRARWTRKNLARFNKTAKKKGTIDSLSVKTVSTTSSDFAIRAHRNSILDPLNSKPPTNLENIHEQHARSRATASPPPPPPESRFKRYSCTVSKAGNKATMAYMDVGFNNGPSALRPDFAEVPEMQEYDPFPVDEHVSGAVLYKDDPYSVTLPHLAGEWEGPDGSTAEATLLRSRHAGAALVYARNRALSLIGTPDPPGHAEVRTFATDGTTIAFYAYYAAPSEDDATLEYHQYQSASANKQRRGGVQPITEGAPLPDPDEVEEPLPSAKSPRYRRTRKRAALTCSINDKSGCGIIDTPSYAPTPLRSSGGRPRSSLYFHKYSNGKTT